MTAARPIRRGPLTLFLMLAVLMQALDGTIANVALPYMQGALSASQDQIDWVLTSYIVAAAVLTPSAGWLAARFGRTRVFVGAIIGFVFASILCGMSVDITEIVGARLLQGAFGAALVPLAQAVLIDIYPLEQRGRAMALYGIGVMVGPILGPLLGGWLTEHYTWRWVFYVNVPIGALAAFGLFMYLPESPRQRAGFDWTGFGLLAVAIGAFQAMLDRGQQLDWFGSPEIIAEAAAAALCFYCFIVHFLLAEKPFLTPRLFRDSNFIAGVLCMTVCGMSMYATLALISPYLQNLAGYPVLTAGFTMVPNGIGTVASMFICGRLVNHIRPRWIILGGFAMLIAALHMMTRFSPDSARSTIMAASFLQGSALGFVFISLSIVTFATLPADLRTQGAGVYSLARNMGSSVGISVTGSLLARNIQVNHASIAALVTPFNRALQTGAPAQYWNPMHRAGAAALDGVITRNAAAIAYTDDFKLLMLAAICAMPIAFMVRTGGRPAKPDPAHALPD